MIFTIFILYCSKHVQSTVKNLNCLQDQFRNWY